MLRAMGASRFVYNLALEQRMDWWRPGRRFSFYQQSRELSDLRRDLDWLAAVPRAPLQFALRDLDQAFRAFFAKRARFPRFRAKGDGAMRYQGRDVSVEAGAGRFSRCRIPGVGWIRYRDTRALSGDCLSVSVRLRGGRWFAGFVCEIGATPATSSAANVGIDRGVANAVALSTGELFRAPERLATLARRAGKAQRALARKHRGSKRYARQRARLCRLTARAANIRADFNHRLSADIARRFGTVAIEALNTKSMTRAGKHKRGLNRAILNQGWGQLAFMLNYKLAARGGALIKVDPRYTSQTCSACGAVDPESRKSQAVFECVHCGHCEHADVNAAKEILRRSTPGQSAEAARWRADEALTRAVA